MTDSSFSVVNLSEKDIVGNSNISINSYNLPLGGLKVGQRSPFRDCSGNVGDMLTVNYEIHDDVAGYTGNFEFKFNKEDVGYTVIIVITLYKIIVINQVTAPVEHMYKKVQ